MLFLLSPAKSLDYASRTPAAVARLATTPVLIDRSVRLMARLQQKSAAEVAALMRLSTALAELNVDRYRAWTPDFTTADSRPAVLAFDGDVYAGLQARTLTTADMRWAQGHLVILSGLHGVLRPLDRIRPYRLEMGTTLATEAGRNLYEYWGSTLADFLNRSAAVDRSPVIVNLASQEYFKAVDRRALRARVVECVFEDWKDGRYKVIGFFAKRARGLMARHAVQRRVATPAGLKTFGSEGYGYDDAPSTPDRFVFRRRLQ